MGCRRGHGVLSRARTGNPLYAAPAAPWKNKPEQNGSAGRGASDSASPRRGKAAEASYRSTIVDARNVSGQASFEAARVEWARAANLEPDDGIYLGELRDGPTKLTELTAAVAICGKSASDATKALKRLVSAGFIEATPGA